MALGAEDLCVLLADLGGAADGANKSRQWGCTLIQISGGSVALKGLILISRHPSPLIRRIRCEPGETPGLPSDSNTKDMIQAVPSSVL